MERRTLTGITLSEDTLFNQFEGTMTLPSQFGFGVSLVNVFKWTAGVDVRLQNWSNYSNFDGSNEGLDNSMLISVGGEYTPDAGDINKLLKRVSYRIGFSYEKTPQLLNNENIKDIGINFGMSIPVSNISSLDLGFKYGTKGSISKIGLKEDYFKFQMGLTLNDRLWFIKRKFD
jgi:hypothetical protein